MQVQSLYRMPHAAHTALTTAATALTARPAAITLTTNVADPHRYQLLA